MCLIHLGESVLIQILFSALYTKLLEASKTETMDGDGGTNSPENQEQKSSICNVLAEAICSIDEDNKVHLCEMVIGYKFRKFHCITAYRIHNCSNKLRQRQSTN